MNSLDHQPEQELQEFIGAHTGHIDKKTDPQLWYQLHSLC